MFVDNLSDFIVYIAPGFIATEVYKLFFPAKEKKAFSQIAWSIIWALFIVTSLNLIDKIALNNLLHSNTKSPLSEPYYLCSLMLMGVIFGLVGVYQFKARVWLSNSCETLEWLAPERDSIWKIVNDSEVRDWAVVSLANGDKYLGWITNYKFDPDETNQEFLLGHARKVDEKINEIYVVDGIGVYLNTRDVISIEYIKGN